MNRSHSCAAAVVVAGCGSPHGDDQLGWQVVQLLHQRPQLPAVAIILRDCTDLIGRLNGCKRLIVVDACQSHSPIGEVKRFRWPDARIAAEPSPSRHGLTIDEVLRLADCLGRLPPMVDVWAVEIGPCATGPTMSPAALVAAAQVEAVIYDELCEAAHA